jgi:bifunctional NMN adenylyltransferase/nudix hydrolase
MPELIGRFSWGFQVTISNRKFDYAVVIGRFQPVHYGHQRLLEHALRSAHRVIVVVGSDALPRSYKNPFTFDERERMIRSCLRGSEQPRVSVAGVKDYPYNEAVWIASVQSSVDRLIAADGSARGTTPSIALVGHLKDDSSYYLRSFPKWQFEAFDNVESLNASDIRRIFFAKDAKLSPADIPEPTLGFLTGFQSTEHYATICDERSFIEDYKQRYRYAGSDFPPIYTTVDAVVVEVGYILLVQRKFHPGRGTWALPGGFVGQHETLLDAAIRELREETKLKVPTPVLSGSLKGSHVFDAPDRSQRGRTITHAFYFELAHNQWTGLPDVKASDDAAKAQWVPVAKFLDMREQIYEDHFHIAMHFLGGQGV